MTLFPIHVQVVERAEAELRRVLGILDGHLRLRTYLVGEAVTLADIAVACTLLLPYKYVSIPTSQRWCIPCLFHPPHLSW